MRDIIFKGKRKDNSEWVEGYLLKVKTLSPSSAKWVEKTLILIQQDEIYEVLPETVGQYTGRNVGADKLFEGDIIEWVEDYDDNWGDSKTYIGRSIVIWDNDNSCWAVKTDTYIQFFNDFSWDRCYVIGNIHDNPELLEVK